MIPCLMICHNRLYYTKKALQALIESDCGIIYVFDNNSADGTPQYLKGLQSERVKIVLNKENTGIAGAFNFFLAVTKKEEFVSKVDNDTIVPKDFFSRMVKHMDKADIIQAKHALIKASGVGTFDQWVSKMPQDGALRYNHFIGGSGIVCRRSELSELTHTKSVLMSWRMWQMEHPEVRKAFATDVEIILLDTNENGADYSMFPDYYKQTGRV